MKVVRRLLLLLLEKLENLQAHGSTAVVLSSTIMVSTRERDHPR